MITKQAFKLDKEERKETKQIMLGAMGSFIVSCFFIFNVSIHETLHSFILNLYNTPNVVIFNYCITPFMPVSWNILLHISFQYNLSRIFPYLFPIMLGVASLGYGVWKKRLMIITFGIVMILLNYVNWLQIGYGEYLALWVSV